MYLFWLRMRPSVLHAGFLQLLQTGATVESRCTGFSPRRLLAAAANTGSGAQASGVVAQGAWPPGSRAQAQRLWHRAWPLRGMRALPGSGVEAGFPALAGEFFTTGPAGKP